jgi:hypothetical protein
LLVEDGRLLSAQAGRGRFLAAGKPNLDWGAIPEASLDLAAGLFSVAANVAGNASKDMPTVVSESIGVDFVPRVRVVDVGPAARVYDA